MPEDVQGKVQLLPCAAISLSFLRRDDEDEGAWD
jgi:hypothetical protein